MADRGDTHYRVPNAEPLVRAVSSLALPHRDLLDGASNDWSRPWKHYQREFRAIEVERAREALAEPDSAQQAIQDEQRFIRRAVRAGAKARAGERNAAKLDAAKDGAASLPRQRAIQVLDHRGAHEAKRSSTTTGSATWLRGAPPSSTATTPMRNASLKEKEELARARRGRDGQGRDPQGQGASRSPRQKAEIDAILKPNVEEVESEHQGGDEAASISSARSSTRSIRPIGRTDQDRPTSSATTSRVSTSSARTNQVEEGRASRT